MNEIDIGTTPGARAPSQPQLAHLRELLAQPLTQERLLAALTDIPAFAAALGIPANGGAAASDVAYGPSWNGVATTPPSKNAVFDKIEAMVALTGVGPPIHSLLLSGGLLTAQGGSLATPLTFIRDTSGFGSPLWRNGTRSIHAGAGAWNVDSADYSYLATVSSVASSPIGLADWTVVAGSGQPVITLGAWTAASFVGQRYFDTRAGSWWTWNGTIWTRDASPVARSTTPPLNPTEGMEWFDTTTGILSVWYVDAWVVGGTGGVTLPFAYINSTGGKYITSTGGFYLPAA